MRVLAVDPGYDRAGVAVLSNESGKETLLYSVCVRTNARDQFADRLFFVVETVEKLIAIYRPDVFALENLFFNTNQKTAMRVAEVRGALVYLSRLHRLKLREYTPLQVKIAVSGYGRCTKADIVKMLHRIIRIEKKIAYDDEYDAIAVGISCLVCEKNILSNVKMRM